MALPQRRSAVPDIRPSDADLVAGMSGGDVDALAELYDRYGRLAYSMALKVLGDQQRAEDVVQETFLKVWNGASNFDARKGSVRTWLLTAVRNRSVDHLRGRAGRERRELELPSSLVFIGPGGDPWREVSLAIERETVREAVARLPSDQRQAIELAYFGGYTQREIADLCGVPLSTVKGRTRLALEKLRSYMEGKGLFDV